MDVHEIRSWCEDNPQFAQYFGYASGYTYVNCKDYVYGRQEVNAPSGPSGGPSGTSFDEVGNAVQGWMDQFAASAPPLPKSSTAGAGVWLVDQQAKERAAYLESQKVKGRALAIALQAKSAQPRKLSVKSSGTGKTVAVVSGVSLLGALAWFMLRRTH